MFRSDVSLQVALESHLLGAEGTAEARVILVRALEALVSAERALVSVELAAPAGVLHIRCLQAVGEGFFWKRTS